MAVPEITLNRLLAGDLPLDLVGPHLRHACRRALRSGDQERMRLAAKVLVEELVRRGEIVSVPAAAITAGTHGPGPFAMVKSTRVVLDLSVLGDLSLKIPSSDLPITPVQETAPAPKVKEKALPGLNIDAFTRMLWAMERAQDLEIGDPRSGEKLPILSSILNLLERFLPAFPMCILLHGGESLAQDHDRLFHIGPDEAEGGWFSLRTPGHSVWIPNPAELPGHIRKMPGGDSCPPGLESPPPFQCGVAVPLWEPMGNGNGSSSPHETGLLFLIAREKLERDRLMPLAELLSRFVTRRWQHQREVNQRIHVDGLTGTYNRAFFDVQFPLELERARRSEGTLTLIIADLDKFKVVNDTYGHQAGDAALRMVARRLQEELRRIDLICRVGGEEFALILPDTSQAAAQDVVGRLLDSEFSVTVSADGESTDIKVTLSYGAVSFPAAGADPKELFRKADELLYLSKDLGRNRCHFWTSDGDNLQILPSESES